MNAGGKLIDLSTPKVMGILNITPDSFYDGWRHHTVTAALAQADRLLTEGADMLDIGAYSSRPGAADVSAAEESDRLLPVIEAISSHFPEAVLSIDTLRATVARAGIAAGAHIITDISGATLDDKMFATIADLQEPYTLTHMRGTANTMQRLTTHRAEVTGEVSRFYGRQVATLRQMGVRDIILAPGLGFAKALEQNYALLSRLETLHVHELPILGAISRKSMIYKKLGIKPDDALNGTTVLNTVMLMKGVHILRVHDVKAAKEAIAFVR